MMTRTRSELLEADALMAALVPRYASVWFCPTRYSAACYYRRPLKSGLTYSECGTWISRIGGAGTPAKGVVPDFEICQKCAARLGLKGERLEADHRAALNEA